MKTVRLIELFAGIGSQAMALRDLGIPYESYKAIEIDKYAMASYNAIHGTDFEVSDITKIHSNDLEITDSDKFTYLLTYSFPCVDLSVAGRGKGMRKGDNTRSGLLWEVERILLECEEGNCLPQILLMENVPQVHSKKNINDFEDWIGTLEFLGYKNYYDDFNAKDFTIPQSRNRCFMVSFLNDCIPAFHFPKPMVLEYTMKDFLEDEVDEKYYIYSDKAKELINKLIADDKLITDRQTDRQTVDLSINRPRIIKQANCISARTDRGISNQAAEGSGVVEITRF